MGKKVTSKYGLLSGSGIMSAAVGAGMTVLDYKVRKEQGQSGFTSAVASVASNLIPSLLFNGPRALLYEGLYRALPLVPGAISLGYNAALDRGSYLRQSALPFSTYGYQPTAGAIQAMGRALRASGDMSSVGEAHASLASQALRRR